MKAKILKSHNMSKYTKNLLVQVIENLEKTIKKGGNKNQIAVLIRKVNKLKQVLTTEYKLTK